MRGAGRIERDLADLVRLAIHPRGVLDEDLQRVGVDHRADVGGQQAGVAHRQLGHRAGQHRADLVGDVLLHEQHARGRAALAGGLEGGGDHILDDLLGQCGGVGDHRVLAAGLGDQRGDRRVARGQCTVDRPRRVGGAGEGDAGHARVAGQGRADRGTIAGQILQHVGGHAGGVQQLDGQMADQRGLLGGLGDHRVAGGQRGADLAEEDRQREVPRADADEHAAAVEEQLIAFAGGAGQLFGLAEQAPRHGGVVAQDVGRFADLGDRVGQALAGFAHAQRDEFAAARFELLGRVLENGGAAGGGQPVPTVVRGDRVGQRAVDGGGIGGRVMADGLAAVGGIGHRHRGRGRHRGAGYQRTGGPRAGVRVDRVGHRLQFVVVGEVDAHGVLPGDKICMLRKRGILCVDVHRQRDARMRDRGEAAHALAGVGDQLAHRHALVHHAVDEAGVGAVLEQPPHQVGQQVLMRADRRVDTAGHVQLVLADHLGVQVGAHAVQALVFVRAALRQVMHGGDGVRIVGGELRIDQLAAGMEQAPRAGQVRHVGVRLARVHRVARQSVFLRTLDLGVPVGALHQPHVPAAICRTRGFDQPVDHERRALGVRLHHDAQAVPAVQRGMCEHVADDVQRQFQPFGLLGVHRQRDAVPHRQLRQLQQLRGQLAARARALGHLIARMQRGQLHRDRGCLRVVGERAARADRSDRVAVVLLVAFGGFAGQRGLAEHVVRVTVERVFLLRAAVQCLVDAAPHHELVAHDAHGLAHRQADRRLARAANQPAQRAAKVMPGFLGQAHQLSGEHQAPGGGVDEQRLALAQVFLPVGVTELVADQLVGGGLVGDAQQRFGHAHQQHAFLAGKIVLPHERLDRTLVFCPQAHARDQLGGQVDHLAALARRQRCFSQQVVHRLGFVAQPGRGDARARRAAVGGKFGTENGLGHGLVGESAGSGGSARLYAAACRLGAAVAARTAAACRTGRVLIVIRTLRHSCPPARRGLLFRCSWHAGSS